MSKNSLSFGSWLIQLSFQNFHSFYPPANRRGIHRMFVWCERFLSFGCRWWPRHSCFSDQHVGECSHSTFQVGFRRSQSLFYVVILQAFEHWKYCFFSSKSWSKNDTNSVGNRLRRWHESSLKSPDWALQRGELFLAATDIYHWNFTEKRWWAQFFTVSPVFYAPTY